MPLGEAGLEQHLKRAPSAKARPSGAMRGALQRHGDVRYRNSGAQRGTAGQRHGEAK